MGSSNPHAHQKNPKPRVLLKWKNMSRAVAAKEKFAYRYRGRNLKKSGTSARYVQVYTIKIAETHHISPFCPNLSFDDHVSVFYFNPPYVLCMSLVMCIVSETTEKTGETEEL